MTKDDTVKRIRDIELRIENALEHFDVNYDVVESELLACWRSLKALRCSLNTSKGAK